MNEALIHEIVVRFRGGASMRHIAQSLRISRRTVKQALDQVEQDRGVGSTERSTRKKVRSGSQLDAHLGELAVVDPPGGHEPEDRARHARPPGERGGVAGFNVSPYDASG